MHRTKQRQRPREQRHQRQDRHRAQLPSHNRQPHQHCQQQRAAALQRQTGQPGLAHIGSLRAPQRAEPGEQIVFSALLAVMALNDPQGS